MFIGRKYVETEESFLQELTCFLKYQMPLTESQRSIQKILQTSN